MEKWKSKIRKLLALAQSDNPHEAERAKVQAQKLMSKHGLTEEDSEIETISSTISFPRANPKESEVILMKSIDDISGCISHMNYTRKFGKRSTVVQFMGVSRDASIAAYCWDVLYSQLVKAQKELKSQYRVNALEVERYSLAWVISACRKLIKAFGHKDTPKTTSRHYEETSEKFGKARTLKAAKASSPETDSALLSMGGNHGKEASLYVAAENARRNEMRLQNTKLNKAGL